MEKLYTQILTTRYNPFPITIDTKEVKVVHWLESGYQPKLLVIFDLKDKLNWNALELHAAQSCKCDRSSIEKKRRKDVNEKRKAFYKTKKGIVIKQMYKDRMAMKKKHNHSYTPLIVSFKHMSSVQSSHVINISSKKWFSKPF